MSDMRVLGPWLAGQNIQAAIQEYLAARDELLDGAVVREIEVTL